ncbi:(Fe-S)-binding protein [Chloroflexota bacterium]
MVKKSERFTLGLNLEDYKCDARDCVGCAGCKWLDFIYMPGWDFSWRCPPWQKYQYDAYGACGKLKIVHDLLNGRLEYSEPTLPEVIYACSLCGACDAGCKRNLDLEPLMTLEALRAKAVEEGIGPMPQHQAITKNILTSRNRYGRPQAQRLAWMPKDVKPAEKADILYFAGCRASFVSTEISQAAARIMQAAKVDFMVMKDEPCCGNYLYTTGQVEKAKQVAEENIKLVEKTGAKTVVFTCAEGYKTFKVDYPKLLGISTADLPFELLHLVEVADQWLKDGRLKLKKNVNMKVTYHDSCNLGRLSEPWVHWEGERGDWSVYSPARQIRRGTYGVYDQPRDILKAIPGIELVEMPRHSENAWCCGNAAGVKDAFPDLASWGASERIREAGTTGAEIIVSACPGCKDNFNQSIKATGNRIKAYDIVELVAKAISK